MPKIKAEDFKTITNVIGTYARDLNLIPKDADVHYYKGNNSNGISSWLEVTTNEGTPQREAIRNVDFLPTFNYKIGQAQQYRELVAVYKVLTAMVRVKNAEHGRPDILVHPSIG